MTADEPWVSDIPQHGVVRAVVVDGAFAARFDDLNGDGREVALSVFARASGSWTRIAYQDDSGVPGVDETPLFGWSGSIGWAVGRGVPGERLEIEWAGERAVVGVDADGWWLGVISGEEPEDDDLQRWPGPRTRPFT